MGTHRAQSTEKEKAPSERRRPPPDCKWFMKGTCKFGTECRYIHKDPSSTDATSRSPKKNKSKGPPRERSAASKAHKHGDHRSHSRSCNTRRGSNRATSRSP